MRLFQELDIGEAVKNWIVLVAIVVPPVVLLWEVVPKVTDPTSAPVSVSVVITCFVAHIAVGLFLLAEGYGMFRPSRRAKRFIQHAEESGDTELIALANKYLR